jgi:hypothetical protein
MARSKAGRKARSYAGKYKYKIQIIYCHRDRNITDDTVLHKIGDIAQ